MTTQEIPDISVVLPVYRTRRFLQELYTRLSSAIGGRGFTYELIFVDDSCPEGSLQDLKELEKDDAHVRALTTGRNQGQHRAVLHGLGAARGHRIVIMDADLQDPPEAIPLLISEAEKGFDAVFAGRRGKYESRGRLFTSSLYKSLLHRLSRVPRDAGLFVLISRRMKDALLANSESTPFLVPQIGLAGFPVTSVPVERSPRPEGTSAYTSWKRLRTGIRTLAWVCAARAHKLRRTHS